MTQPLDAPPPRRFTIREYYDREAAAECKHEFVDGEILAMSGGSYASSTIENNLAGELWSRLKGNPCRPHGSNLKVRIPRTGRVRYPDALVVCDEPRFDPDDPREHTITNPRLIVEILSPSTERTDRTTKFDDYRSVPGFQEYVLIAQVTPRVETFFRTPDGDWKFDVAVGLDATARLASIGIELPLAEAYAGVAFPPPEPDPDDERTARGG